MLEFASSTQSTLGIEWEVALVDRASGEAITPVVCDLDSGEPLDPRRIRWELEATTGTASP